MVQNSGTTSSRAWSPLEAGAAAALAVWRIAAISPAHWWRDWVLIVSVWWAWTVFRSKSPAWAPVTASVVAYLLGIYFIGQFPHTWASLRPAP